MYKINLYIIWYPMYVMEPQRGSLLSEETLKSIRRTSYALYSTAIFFCTNML